MPSSWMRSEWSPARACGKTPGGQCGDAQVAVTRGGTRLVVLVWNNEHLMKGEVPGSGRSLRSMLTKVKDALSMVKMSKVVYQVPAVAARLMLGRRWGDLKPEWRSTGMSVRREHWRSQHLQSMHGRAITQSNGRRPQWLTRPGPPRSCCWKRQSTSGCWNPP